LTPLRSTKNRRNDARVASPLLLILLLPVRETGRERTVEICDAVDESELGEHHEQPLIVLGDVE
jgi:hypothetical protein